MTQEEFEAQRNEHERINIENNPFWTERTINLLNMGFTYAETKQIGDVGHKALVEEWNKRHTVEE